MLFILSIKRVAQWSQQFGLKVLKYKKTFKKLFKIRHISYENWPNVDLLTMLWTTEVFILNKIINEQQPRVESSLFCIILQEQVVVDDDNWILQYVTFDRVGNIIA